MRRGNLSTAGHSRAQVSIQVVLQQEVASGWSMCYFSKLRKLWVLDLTESKVSTLPPIR